MGARYWRMLQDTDTRVGTSGYEWHFGWVGFYASMDGSGANLATVSNTTASPSRGGQGIGDILSESGMYIFGSCLAGQGIIVDAGVGNIYNVLSAGYKNVIGPSWAPETVKIQFSSDGIEWIDAKTYTDAGSTVRQVITGIIGFTIAAPANYLCSRGRDRTREKGISLGAKVKEDGSPSFLTARRNRLRITGVSLEDALPTVPPFSPSDIPGLLAWHGADAITGKVDGEAIQTWSDLSGNNKHFTQTDASARPLYKTNIINGLPALLFDGANDFMDASPVTGIRTVVVVAKYTAAVFGEYPGLITGQSGNIWFLGSMGSANWYTGESATLTWYKDGVQSSQEVTNAWHVFLATAGAAQTFTPRIGQDRPYVGRNWFGYVAEAIIYDSVLDADNTAQLTTFLKTKYGIA